MNSRVTTVFILDGNSLSSALGRSYANSSTIPEISRFGYYTNQGIKYLLNYDISTIRVTTVQQPFLCGGIMDAI